MTIGFAVEQLHILKKSALCKATQRPAPVSHLNLKERALSKSSIRSDDVHTEKSTTAEFGKQWSLKCTWRSMSELVWLSYKVIKVAICLHRLGEEIDFFFNAVIRKSPPIQANLNLQSSFKDYSWSKASGFSLGFTMPSTFSTQQSRPEIQVH